MKVTALFVCWIALASLIGLIFGFTAVGLTPTTAVISLSAGFVLPLVGLLFHRKASGSDWRIHWTDLLLTLAFLAFAIRAFYHLIYVKQGEIRVSSPNNIGDICLHLSHINYLASNPQFWPDNPIFAFQKLHYPFGINLFNAELKLVGVAPIWGLLLVAFLGSLLTLRALFLFNGAFGVAAFLFNGGLAGFLIFQTGVLLDYQSALAWKSIPLAMFITQRGLLYTIPAALLLLTHWRNLYFEQRRLLPFWAEWLLYATMPFFHVHTFLFLSFLLLWWFLFGHPNWRGRLLRLVLLSLVPASALVYFVVGFAHDGAIGWDPGWMRPHQEPIWWFWLNNFGLFLPLTFALLVYFFWPKGAFQDDSRRYLHLLFFPALLTFIACAFVKFAPWAWDNTKLIFWAYLVILYCAWRAFFERWPVLVRIPIFVLLFFSGAVSLAGGLQAMGHHGYVIGEEREWKEVGSALRGFTPDSIFAAYPTYNSPVLVTGHQVVLGYEGHLWSHGLPYEPYWPMLQQLMAGAPDWQTLIKPLQVDYIFWGRFEQYHYPTSTKPWEKICPIVARGPWGTVYDLRALAKSQP